MITGWLVYNTLGAMSHFVSLAFVNLSRISDLEIGGHSRYGI